MKRTTELVIESVALLVALLVEEYWLSAFLVGLVLGNAYFYWEERKLAKVKVKSGKQE